MDANDEIRMRQDALRLLDRDVTDHLLDHGWSVVDLEVGDDESLQWFWPPTAPVGYGGRSTDDSKPVPLLEQMFGPAQTPWIRPTMISRTGSLWRVEYGSAIAQEADLALNHTTDAELLADLVRIECWPMTVDEFFRIRMERIATKTAADAHDLHSQGYSITEPYTSLLNDLRAHIVADESLGLDLPPSVPPGGPRPRGDLEARCRLVEAEAWASAVRTARAGGQGWGLEGPRPPAQ